MERSATNTYKYGRIEIVVHRPHIDDQERKKREAALQRAVACFGREMQKARCGDVLQNR